MAIRFGKVTLALSQHQRLSLAVSGAVLLHAMLFVSGWFVIQQISIPSNEDRALVLTLESTPLDGLLQPDAQTEDTLNDAKVGNPSDLSDPLEPTEISQLSSDAHSQPTFEVEPEIAPTPQPLQESVTQETVVEPENFETDIQATPSAPQSLDTSELNASANAVSNSDSAESPSLDLVTETNSSIKIDLAAEQPVEELTAIREIQQRERKMLEKKLQKWTRKIDLTEQIDENYSWQHKGQTYVAKFSHLPASGSMDLDELFVEISTVNNGQALTTEVRLKKLAFSNFAQFVHRWDPSVMIHDDEMDGRFHSNTQIMVASDRKARPVFHGKVTTASYKIDLDRQLHRGARKKIFQGGLETGVKKIRMPKPRKLFAESESTLDDDTILLKKDTRITFTQEGGVLLEQDSEPARYERLPQHPVYLLADKGVELSVSGTVKGKVLVYSPTRVVIENDLVYANKNLTTSEDVIGIISDRNVVIAGPDKTGDGDLLVFGSIYAKGRFQVNQYTKPHTGTLRVVGSVSAGSISATQPRYATSITFDERFEKMRPPGFPVTDTFEVSEADWSWNVN